MDITFILFNYSFYFYWHIENNKIPFWDQTYIIGWEVKEL